MTEQLYKCQDIEYRIEKSRFGLYTSIRTDNDERMVTGPTEEAVRTVTEDIHIPVLNDCFDGYTSVSRAPYMGRDL